MLHYHTLQIDIHLHVCCANILLTNERLCRVSDVISVWCWEDVCWKHRQDSLGKINCMSVCRYTF